MLEFDQSHAEMMSENTNDLSGVGGLNRDSSESRKIIRNRIASCKRGQEGKEIHRPLLSVCGVRARTSADSGYAFLFARSLLGVVSKQADVDLAMMGEKGNGERTCMGNF